MNQVNLFCSTMMETSKVPRSKQSPTASASVVKGGRGRSSDLNDAKGGDDVSTKSTKQKNKALQLKPSASSCVLELLDITAKRKRSESQMNMSLSPSIPQDTNATAANSSATQAAGNSAGVVKQPQNPKSVVPQLMDIYSDLAQSSTPQITTVSTNLNSVPAMTLSSSNPPMLPPPSSTRPTSSTSISSLKRNTSSNGTNTSNTSRKRGKTASSDKRWSKRFTWPDDLHRDFVSAIFEVGLKHSSPSALMEHMEHNPDITSERLKSHLQKYRLNRQKSKKEFMTSYDNALEGFRKRASQLDGEQDGDTIEGEVTSLSCAEPAALCTHDIITGRSDSSEESRKSSPLQEGTSSIFHMPPLTRQEHHSAIGQSFRHLAGLYNSLATQLDESRRKQGGKKGSSLPPPEQEQAVAPQFQHQQQQQYYLPLQPTVEHASAASMDSTEPSIHEVAASIPHHYPPQQHSEPQTQQYDQTQVHISNGQNSSSHTPTPQDQVQPQFQHHAQGTHQAEQPFYTHQQAPAPSNQTADGYPPLMGSNHQPLPHNEIPTISHQQQVLQGQSAFSATNPSLAMNHPSAGSASAAQHVTDSTTLQAQKESTMMKQEMKGQMVFQNKIRQLKQTELNKYQARPAAVGPSNNVGTAYTTNNEEQLSPSEHQLFDDLDNDLWNPDNDDHLFSFLME